MKRHSFSADLPWGQACERAFHEMHRGFLTRTDGRRGDFIVIATGDKLELKSESYSTTDPFGPEAVRFREAMRIPTPDRGWRRPSPNLFVERYSSEAEETPGGPWQAQKNGAVWYVHFFAGDGKVFAYRTDDMVDFMERNMHKYRLCEIQNQGYITVGYPVPRARVEHLEVRDLFPAVALDVADEAARKELDTAGSGAR
jgi:hypothetical protein